jgi:hypothetical protein
VLKLESFLSQILRSCNFVSEIKFYQFWNTNRFYISTHFTLLLILG